MVPALVYMGGVMVGGGRLRTARDPEEWVLSRSGASAAGGVSEFGSWCGSRNWGNQDAGSIAKSTLVSV